MKKCILSAYYTYSPIGEYLRTKVKNKSKRVEDVNNLGVQKGSKTCFAVLFFVACATGARIGSFIDSSVQYANECPPEQESNWEIEMLLRHEDCNKFYKCTFGHPVEYKCQEDLYFNLETWQCDWKHNVDCTDRNIPEEDLPSTTEGTTPTETTTELITTTTEPTTTTTEPTTTTTEPTTTTTEPTTTTTEQTTTTTEPTTTTTEPTTTTTEPTTTTTEPTTTTTEPTTTTTEPTTTTTEPTTTTTEPTTTTTEPTTTTTEPTTTTTEPTTTTTEPSAVDIEFLENGCPVDPHIHWLLPHETECKLFYYCVWGRKVLRSCPDTLHFNTVLQVCDWPTDAGCTLPVKKHFSFRQILQRLL